MDLTKGCRASEALSEARVEARSRQGQGKNQWPSDILCPQRCYRIGPYTFRRQNKGNIFIYLRIHIIVVINLVTLIEQPIIKLRRIHRVRGIRPNNYLGDVSSLELLTPNSDSQEPHKCITINKSVCGRKGSGEVRNM